MVAAFDAALETGEPFEIEHRILSAGGENRWFLARAEPYRDQATGEIIRWFGASVDVHDRKLAEERLRELNTSLEQRVAERTAERNMLATILKNTEAYRRDNRRAEYGDERDPAMRAVFQRISPLARVGRITKPMLVMG